MKKTSYIMPLTKILVVGNEATMQTASALDPTKGDQTIIPSDEEYDGEFGARMNTSSVWDD